MSEDKIIDLDAQRKEKLIENIRNCDSLHDNCDFLLDHSDCDDLIECIEQLENKNKELKKYYCKRNDCSGRLKENNKLTDSEILTEFEKWLEEEIEKENKQFDFCFSDEAQCRQIEHIGYLEFVLKKLQKLKEGKK